MLYQLSYKGIYRTSLPSFDDLNMTESILGVNSQNEKK